MSKEDKIWQIEITTKRGDRVARSEASTLIQVEETLAYYIKLFPTRSLPNLKVGIREVTSKEVAAFGLLEESPLCFTYGLPSHTYSHKRRQ